MSTRKDQLKSLLLNLAPAAPQIEGQAGPQAAPEQKSAGQGGSAPPRVVSGSVRAMGLSLDRLGAAAQEADALRAQLAAGDAVVEIEPTHIAPSFIADRMEDGAGMGWRAGDAGFDAFLADIREHGQQSPILVRPSGEGEGRYQIAYGHRRWRAAIQLGRKVRAVVRALSDAELVVAQGQENAQRRDLSFIEKAFFARSLDERGFDRSTLVAALAVQTAEITRLLQVARAIPAEIAALIGPAPKAGRPRWMEFADGLTDAAALSRVTTVLEAERTQKLSSDERFARAFSVLKPPKARSAKPDVLVRGPKGETIARLTVRDSRAAFLLDPEISPDFAGYLAEALPGLYERWRKSKP